MKISVFFSVLFTGLIAANAAAQTAPNLAGTWKVDAAKSSAVGGGRGRGEATGGGRGGGLGLGPAPEQLTVSQDVNAITIIERRGEADSTIVLRLGGQAQPRAFAAGRSAGTSAPSVTSIKEGRVLTTVTLPAAPAGGDAVRYEESRYLDKDGSLIVDITMAGSPNSRRVVYARLR